MKRKLSLMLLLITALFFVAQGSASALAIPAYKDYVVKGKTSKATGAHYDEVTFIYSTENGEEVHVVIDPRGMEEGGSVLFLDKDNNRRIDAEDSFSISDDLSK
ncbi:MAG: hypothetical protein KDK66_08355 [Deltaproteobacteria bacterium]|nr:hypothetical protein [Deltaproteobacteria bacterium]